MIKLINERDNSTSKVTVELHEDTDLTSMLEEFEYFLRGSSYVFDAHATIKLVNEEEEAVVSKAYLQELQDIAATYKPANKKKKK